MTRRTYRKAVKLALDMSEYIANNTRTLLPVCGYVASRRIEDVQDIDLVCRIARIMGREVHRRGGVWYENGQKIGGNDEQL